MHRSIHVALSAFVALTAAGTPCLAADAPAQPATASASASADIKVARDKETGQLRAMNAREQAALKANAKAVPPNQIELRRPVTTVVYHADGRMTGKLSAATAERLQVVTTADGKAVMTHAPEAVHPIPAAKAETAAE
jgi:hypothetical protein